MPRDTTVDRVFYNAAMRGNQVALVHRQGTEWVTTDFRTFGEKCRLFAGALLEEGVEPKDAVAIVGDNCPEWVIADVGAMAVRAVPAGIYQTSTPDQLAYVAGHCEAKVLVLHHLGQWEKFVAVRDRLPAVRRVVLIRDAERVSDPMVASFEAFLEKGRRQGEGVDQRFREIQDSDLATLIYTSGTTGPPKGAMISHANLAYMTRIAAEVRGLPHPEETVVSYLPLSHIAEQIFTVHAPPLFAGRVVFAESLDRLKDTLVVGRPTLFLGVPRVWEKFKAALETKLGEVTGVKKHIVAWARSVGLAAGRERLEKGSLSPALRLQYALADRLFFSKLKGQLGLDRLELAVTGAAPIGRDVIEFFLSCGILIHEVYGQTEGSGATTFNVPKPGGTRLGTVGRPISGLSLRIAEDQEILMKSPGVFLGYYKDPAATQATIQDGWLHTGDVGEVDADGFLRITDRKKDLIITSGGKNVAPQNIENLLKGIEGIAQAVVVGDRRRFLTALLTLDGEQTRVLARRQGWPEDRTALVTHPGFLAHVQSAVDRVNTGLARYETIKRFTLLPSEFSVESGELTPTQKVKRKVVAEKFADHIESMYAAEGHDARSP